MEGIEHPEKAANTLKKLVPLHSSSPPAVLNSSFESDQPVGSRRCSKGDHSPEEILNRKLNPEEQVLWKSRPEEQYWTFAVARKILYGTIMLIFPLMFTLAVWPSATRFTISFLSNPIFYFFIVGLLVSGLAIISSVNYSLNSFAAPWKERKLRRSTLYALTEHRLMTIVGHSVRTYSVHKIKEVRQQLRRNGTGNIILKYGKKRIFKFKDIINAREAVDMLKSLRTPRPL